MSTRSITVYITAIAVAPILLLVLMHLAPDEYKVSLAAEPLTRDAVYMSGAAIIAFAIFGSVLSTGIITDKVKKLDRRDLAMVYGGTTLIVTVQGLSMLFACCLVFGAFSLAVVTSMTFVSAVIIIIGFAQIVERQQSGSKGQDNGQSGAHDGKPEDADPKTKQGERQPHAQNGTDTELHFRFHSGRATCHSPDRTESTGQPD